MVLCVSLFMIVSEALCFLLNIIYKKQDADFENDSIKNIFSCANHFLAH